MRPAVNSLEDEIVHIINISKLAALVHTVFSIPSTVPSRPSRPAQAAISVSLPVSVGHTVLSSSSEVIKAVCSAATAL